MDPDSQASPLERDPDPAYGYDRHDSWSSLGTVMMTVGAIMVMCALVGFLLFSSDPDPTPISDAPAPPTTAFQPVRTYTVETGYGDYLCFRFVAGGEGIWCDRVQS